MDKITKDNIVSKYVTFHDYLLTGVWEITHILPCRCKVNLKQGVSNTPIKVEVLLYLVSKGSASIRDSSEA